jgi:hypothetical protein
VTQNAEQVQIREGPRASCTGADARFGSR